MINIYKFINDFINLFSKMDYNTFIHCSQDIRYIKFEFC